MENSNNCLNQIGKILYKFVEIPYNVLIGIYNPEYQQKLKEKRELEARIKSLDSKIIETKEEKENLAYRTLEKINSNKK